MSGTSTTYLGCNNRKDDLMSMRMEMHMHGIRATPGSPSATSHAAPLRICVGTCPPQPASHTQRYVSSGEYMRACTNFVLA